MRKLIGWLAFAILTCASLVVAFAISIWMADKDLPAPLMEHRIEFVFGVTFVAMLPVASKIRHWISGTTAKSQPVSSVRQLGQSPDA
jgi:hypothetical protein